MTQPRVFISYSHDSEKHAIRVMEFADKLRNDGIDANVDAYTPHPEEGWPRWMDREIRESDYVVVICTETYLRRINGEEKKAR